MVSFNLPGSILSNVVSVLQEKLRLLLVFGLSYRPNGITLISTCQIICTGSFYIDFFGGEGGLFAFKWQRQWRQTGNERGNWHWANDPSRIQTRVVYVACAPLGCIDFQIPDLKLYLRFQYSKGFWFVTCNLRRYLDILQDLLYSLQILKRKEK